MEATCFYIGRNIKTEALGRSAGPELQAIEEESTKEEQDSDVTHFSDLEQEDSEILLMEDEQ